MIWRSNAHYVDLNYANLADWNSLDPKKFRMLTQYLRNIGIDLSK